MIIFPKYADGVLRSLNFWLNSLKGTSLNRFVGTNISRYAVRLQQHCMTMHTPPQLNKIAKYNTIGKYTGIVQKLFSMSTSWSSSTTTVNSVVILIFPRGSSPHCRPSFVTSRAMKKPGVEISLFCGDSDIIISQICKKKKKKSTSKK